MLIPENNKNNTAFDHFLVDFDMFKHKKKHLDVIQIKNP